MIHPLLRRLAAQPTLVVEHAAEHAASYAALASVEARAAAHDLRWRIVCWAAAALFTAAAFVLSGVAALLAATLPAATMPAPWLLLALPLVLWLAAASVAWAGLRASTAPAFAHLREQWTSDVRWVRAFVDRAREQDE